MKAKILQFPKHTDVTGTLFVADHPILPFYPRRVFWINGLRGTRGGHALRTCEQIIFALRGEFDVKLHSHRGKRPTRWGLRYPDHGLYIPQMVWRDLYNFSTGSIAMVLCSHPYSSADYIHDLSEFLNEVEN